LRRVRQGKAMPHNGGPSQIQCKFGLLGQSLNGNAKVPSQVVELFESVQILVRFSLQFS